MSKINVFGDMADAYRYIIKNLDYDVKIVDEHANSFDIKKVYFNDPATVVLWKDGTKTVVKCSEEDVYDPQTGLLMCMAKKMYGNNGKFNDILREWLPEEEETHPWLEKVFWTPKRQEEEVNA